MKTHKFFYENSIFLYIFFGQNLPDFSFFVGGPDLVCQQAGPNLLSKILTSHKNEFLEMNHAYLQRDSHFYDELLFFGNL